MVVGIPPITTGNGFTPNSFVGSVAPGWTLAGVGDFTGSGSDDLLWFNNSTGTSTVTNSFCWSNGGGSEHHECIYDGGLANSVVDNTVLDNMRDETAAIFYDNPDSGGTGTTGTLDAENDIFSGGSNSNTIIGPGGKLFLFSGTSR